jgi:hypothetical protein
MDFKDFLNFKSILKIINYILFFGFLAFGIFLLFIETSKILRTITVLASFFASWALLYVLRQRKINEKYWIIINLALWLNIAGELTLYWGGSSLYYDKFLHLVLGALITLLVYEHYLKNLKPEKDAVFFTVLGMLALWEIFEFTLDSLFQTNFQGVFTNGVFTQSPITDTMYDLICGSIGSIIVLFFKKNNIIKIKEI